MDIKTKPEMSRGGKLAISLISLLIAAYGAMIIYFEHFLGRTKKGDLVESVGLSAVCIGLSIVGVSMLMGSLVLPQKLKRIAIVVGAVLLAGGVFFGITLNGQPG